MNGGGREIAIAGVGYSPVTRNAGAAPDSRVLTVAACRAAIADAGLAPGDVDGIFQYSFGFESPIASAVQGMLGIENLHAYMDVMASGPSGLAAANAAAMAVASGTCEVAVCYRTMTQAAGKTGTVVQGPAEAAGAGQWTTVYGVAGAIMPFIAMMKRRRMVEFGRPEEDFGHIALNARSWSALNERAMLRDPLTMDDYLSSRYIVDPLRLLDCDYPVNGACALVITTAERARDLVHDPVYIDAVAFGTGAEPDWAFHRDLLYGGTRHCAERLWSRSSITPADLGTLGLYDGFTHITISWIEALGLCGPGEFGDWVDEGRTIGPGGRVPLNTSGGQLAEGRLHGLGLLAEVVVQLRGTAPPERQIAPARFGAVANAHGPMCGAMLLRTVPA